MRQEGRARDPPPWAKPAEKCAGDHGATQQQPRVLFRNRGEQFPAKLITQLGRRAQWVSPPPAPQISSGDPADGHVAQRLHEGAQPERIAIIRSYRTLVRFFERGHKPFGMVGTRDPFLQGRARRFEPLLW